MKYNELQVTANKDRKRVGRGISAGQGKTAGRGTKGQGARTGTKKGPMFQGGSGALVRRTPKARGFKSLRTPAQVVYLDTLNTLSGTVNNMTLFDAGLIGTPFHAAKVIARGELSAKITLEIAFASKSVQEALVKNGGSFTKTAVPLRESAKKAEESEK